MSPAPHAARTSRRFRLSDWQEYACVAHREHQHLRPGEPLQPRSERLRAEEVELEASGSNSSTLAEVRSPCSVPWFVAKKSVASSAVAAAAIPITMRSNAERVGTDCPPA